MTFPKRNAFPALALCAALSATLAGGAMAQDNDGVQGVGETGDTDMYGVTGSVDGQEGVDVPEDMEALVDALENEYPEDIGWDTMSSLTKIELVRLSRLDGNADDSGLSDWMEEATSRIDSLRADVAEVPALTAALDESGFGAEDVIAAFGSSADTVALVIDDRG